MMNKCSNVCPADAGGSGRGALSPRIGGLALRGFTRDQQLAQHIEIAPQYAQSHIPLKSLFGSVAATFQVVARLQRANRRLDPGMRLPRLAKFDARQPIKPKNAANAAARPSTFRKPSAIRLLSVG